MFIRIISILFLGFLFSCNGKNQENNPTIEEVKKEQDQFYAQTEANDPDLDDARKLITSIDKFVKENPEHEESPDLLYDVARIYANYFHNYIEAIDYYNRVYKDYPDFRKAPDALFTEAYFYETQLNDIEKARELYTRFIRKYPNHDLADDARFSLDNLGRSAEEIYRDIIKQKQSKDSAAVQ